MARMLIITGFVLIAVGVFWQFGSRLGWGKLPGDVHIRSGQSEFHFPIVTCLLISAGISLLAWIIKYLRS